ncbi:MAG: leucyl aminopeptidase [Tissierellia bacterium]|nr:leucyl aminopeptidase [Tissierellia bacterium]
MKLVLNEKKDLKVSAVFEDLPKCEKRQKLADNKLFEGKYGTSYMSLDLDAKGHIWLGLGDSKDINGHKLIESFYKIAKELKKLNVNEIALKIQKQFPKDKKFLLNVLEGFLQAEYKWEDYKTEKSDDFELTVSLLDADEDILKDFEELKNLIEGVGITRTLVNIPANDLYPETLANKVVDLFKDTEVEVEVLDKKQCEELGMEAMLQVARGSSKEPRFIIMRYMPLKGQKDHLTFVGKGLTYDSGGYALKPASGMVTMKCDMGGAGSVIGALYALEKNKVQKNVVGVIAAVENMVSGDAYKNGDIIGSMKKTRIEIGNTDAEGRVTLADSLYYSATKLNSKAIVDLATLTGACIVALGEKTTGMVSNDDHIANLLLEASSDVSENLHRFSVFDVHREQIKGTFGDIKNSTKGGAGSITAGLFLEHFVEGKPWAHLDIAGPAYFDNAWSYYPAGGSGIPVKTIYEFAKRF